MIAFLIIGLLLLGGAVAIITTRDLVHAVLWLALTLVATAAAFVLLRADLLAAVQIMLYTGGIITLMLFAVMLTRRLAGSAIRIESRGWIRSLPIPLLFVGMVASAIFRSDLPDGPVLAAADAQGVGKLFLTQHVLAFEVLSALLLISMIGAIAIARKKDA